MEGVKQAVARLESEFGENGTAFLVSEEYMLTAKHTILSYSEGDTFKVYFSNHPSEKEYVIDDVIYEVDKVNDVAILKLGEAITEIKPLTISFTNLLDDSNWESYGYPVGDKRIYGERYSGVINDTIHHREEEKFDVNLFCKRPQITDVRSTLDGASGSPIMQDGAVIAIFSNDGTGSIIGAASLNRSKKFIEEHITVETREKLILHTFIDKAISNAERYIEGFPDDLQSPLYDELSDLQRIIVENIDDIQEFLVSSKYPVIENQSLVSGIEETIEIILMIKCIYGNVQILVDDDFANVRIIGEKKQDMNFVYSQERNKFMPEVLLMLHNQMINKSAAQIMIDFGKPIPPHPLILDNFSNSKRHNLCHSCGHSFNFENILQTFIDNEDDDLIKGIESNNFSLLKRVKIICGECLRRVRDEVNDLKELKSLVGEKLNV